MSPNVAKKAKVSNAQFPTCVFDDYSRSGQKQETGKCIWLLSYASGSPDVDQEMLQSVNVICDECYTATWRESKYTLVHMSPENRLRPTAIQKAMHTLNHTHDIISNNITGYETLSSNDKHIENVREHPGFKRMIDLLNSNSSEIRTWLKSGDVMTNKKGLLWEYIKSINPKEKTHGQLVKQVVKLTPLVRENEALHTENELFKAENQALRAALDEEIKRSTKFQHELETKTKECTELKSRLIEQNKDFTWTSPSAQ